MYRDLLVVSWGHAQTELVGNWQMNLFINATVPAYPCESLQLKARMSFTFDDAKIASVTLSVLSSHLAFDWRLIRSARYLLNDKTNRIDAPEKSTRLV